MKKCPFCGADLADEAQFCLYCMTPLGEKEQILPAKRRPKGWLFVLGSILILAVVILLLWPGAGNEPSDPVMQVTTAPTTMVTTVPTTVTPAPTTITTLPSSSVTTVPTTVPTTTSPTAKPTTASTTTVPTPEATAAPTTKPVTSTTQPSTSFGTDEAGVQYYYRLSESSDWEADYNYQNPGNHITITGIKVPSSNGIYRIPETIDGMTVAFIGQNAFNSNNGRTAKIVYVPESVLGIYYGAFDNCPIEHIYFTHNIFINNYAFSDSKNILTIHCPEDARRTASGLYYSKESMKFSRASWEEWNGLEMTATDDNGIVYFYRPSTASDHAADPTYQNPGNHITITGVKVQNSSDIYHIPETLNGMTVAFIGKDAFLDTNAKAVYLSQNVIAVAGFAFTSASFTDIYFTHNLYIYPNAFPYSLGMYTMHCPKNARCGSDGVYYCERAHDWNGGSWEEWNGEV